MGITYWLVPFITKRALWSPKMALVQAWSWFIGMGMFSHFMHTLGLLSMPRRTMIGASPYLELMPQWKALLPYVGIGATIMFISAILYYLNMVMTIFKGKPDTSIEIPFSKAISGPSDVPVVLDRWKPWLALAFLMIVINYIPLLISLITSSPFNIPGMRTW